MSRQTKAAIAVFAVVLFIFIAWLDKSSQKQFPSSATDSVSNHTSSRRDCEKYDGKTFTVINIVDGDTIDINIFDAQHNHTRIRLLGVDTPETRTKESQPMYFGPQASAFAKEILLSKEVTIFLDAKGKTRDKYNRLLAYIQLPDEHFFNELLIEEGYAYADLRFKHPFYDKYKSLESIARKQKRGLWENVTLEQMPPWLQKRKLEKSLSK